LCAKIILKSNVPHEYAGWIMEQDAGWKSQDGLAKWLGIGKKFALLLPVKKGTVKKTRLLREYMVRNRKHAGNQRPRLAFRQFGWD
jgi:hypothetical protein